MAYFSASFVDQSSNVIDITADGTYIKITDRSNYRNYSDIATAGGATSITLAVGASAYDDDYNDYELEILAGTGIGQNVIITDYVALTRTATSTFSPSPDATSVYEIGEPGHLKSYFASFRKVVITNPDGSTYTFSSLGDGDATTTPAATATLPITDNYDYHLLGDGLYTVTLYTMPDWSETVAYKFISNVYVYDGGKYYKLLADSLNDVPASSPTIWEEIVDLEDLPAKYRQQVKVAVTCNIQYCYDSYMVSTDRNSQCQPCNNEVFMRDSGNQRSFKLFAILESIPINMYKADYTAVQSSIAYGRQLCCCSNK